MIEGIAFWVPWLFTAAILGMFILSHKEHERRRDEDRKMIESLVDRHMARDFTEFASDRISPLVESETTHSPWPKDDAENELGFQLLGDEISEEWLDK